MAGGLRGLLVLVAAVLLLPVPAAHADSPGELARVKERLDAMAQERGAPRAVSAWWVDPVTDTVVFALNTPPRDPAESRYVDDARAMDPSVRVVGGVPAPTPRADPPTYDLVGGDGIIVGGGLCSIGFVAHTLAGAPRLITAGHCTRAGGQVLGTNNVPIGPVRSSTFNRDGDWGVVDVGPGWRPTPSVSGENRASLAVTGTATAPVGSTVCRSGTTSGWRCGTVKATDVTANYDAGPVTGLVLTDACSEGGDSGGPFMAGSSAVGLLSGGTGDCTTAGGTSLYQPVDEILRAEGLALEVAP